VTRPRRRVPVLIPLSNSTREALRTNLWSVPTLMVILIVGLFAVTYSIDVRVGGSSQLPAWLTSGGPDVARQVLIAIAAAVITVAGVVFSITILVLQLASQQFGPRMLRNFIRDTGTQLSLGAFVATFVYSILVLQSVADPPRLFVPHLSTTVAVGLAMLDVGVLIYFIDHVAVSIQLTSVVSGIARDFRATLAQLQANEWQLVRAGIEQQADVEEVVQRADLGDAIAARQSGFLQAVGYARLLSIATESDAVIRLLHRPGQFVVAGQPLARVSPAAAVGPVSLGLVRAHIVGPNRTLTQDPLFAIDQLVEVALRALSPAVNDTFTALNCIDWLGDCLCHAYAQALPSGVFCDAAGNVRVIEPVVTHERLLKGATDKIRQAGHGMPAVLIRQLENLQRILTLVTTRGQREVVLHHALLVLRAGEQSITEDADRRDVQAAYDALVSLSSDQWEG
jgi:uncharacterized membrane protein